MPMDLILPQSGGGFRGQGSVAQQLLSSGFNVNSLRTLAVLRKEEWLQFDEAVVGVARQRLVGVGALMDRGLTYMLNNALGTTVLQWEQVSDMTPADVSMSGITHGEQDRLEWTLVNMPIPLIHKEFRVNIRALEASRKLGQPLDTAQAAMAATLVSEMVESILFTGTTVTGGSGTVFGLLNETNRNTGNTTANWDTAATGENYVDDVIAMIAALQNDHMYGPYGLFTTYAAWNRMKDDYKANSDKTTISRMLEIPDLEFVLPSSNVPANTAVLVQLTKDVVEIIDGMQPTTVQWEEQGGMIIQFKVMAIILPRVRSTVTNQSGVAHYDPA